MASPQLYATFLLWMLSELFEKLPEVGDPEKPKLVFFFDEAHLLFTDLPSTLQAKIEQVIRLIRSKGVGVYFVTQNPLDVPEVVLGQLGNRVQHALRAFTPKDQKAVRAAAQTFRTNPKLNVESVITELAVGEGPGFLSRRKRNAGRGRTRPGLPAPQPDRPYHARAAAADHRHLGGIWGVRESRGPRIGLRAAEKQSTAVPAPAASQTQPPADKPWYENLPSVGLPSAWAEAADDAETRWSEAMMKSAARSIGSSVGRQIIRGVLGSILGGSSRR